MKNIYVFTGTLSNNTPVSAIESEIKIKISLQQSQFNNGTGDNDPKNIEIVEYAYTNAEPNCFLVFARWQLK